MIAFTHFKYVDLSPSPSNSLWATAHASQTTLWSWCLLTFRLTHCLRISKGKNIVVKRSRMPVHKKAEKSHQNTSPPPFCVGRLKFQFDCRPWKSDAHWQACSILSWINLTNILNSFHEFRYNSDTFCNIFFCNRIVTSLHTHSSATDKLHQGLHWWHGGQP